MYCPQCRVEYREGFTECWDCHVPLEPSSPPDADAQADPSLDLVVVLETDDPVRAALAKGLLEDAGIPFFELGQITTLANSVDGFLHKWVRIQVACDRESEVRELLEQMSQPVTDEEALGEKSPE